jgi:putative mRNA 3-end processing factor
MARLGSWIEPHPEGIYVRPADAWVDPSQPKARALVTHGHADHARGGHGTVWATPETLAIMGVRYGDQNGCEVAYGQSVTVGEVEATCEPFLPVPCDIFITEATFGLPVFHHPDTGAEVDRLLARLLDNPDRCVLVGAYALGKAQRVIAEVRRRDHRQPIFVHGALERLNKLYMDHGIDLGELRPATGAKKAEMAGHIVLCPPGALNDRWSRRLPDPITSMASGWMRIRQRARQRNVELPLIISDHADWGELTDTILEVRPKEVWITHGREDALMHWCMTRQIKARELNLVGYEDDDED